MSTATMTDCTQLDTTLLERVNYFPRQLLTADDMTADQEYFIAKMRRHNRYLHGWGVVCGLAVTIAPTQASPWQVQISPGYALGPYGDEIYVPNPVLLDLAQCGPGASTDPCDPGSLLLSGVAKTGSVIFIAIRYEECLAKPVRVLPGGCGCNDTTCEPSRISDSYEIECLGDLPPSSQPAPPGPSLCDFASGRALAQCLPCPTDPWVVLAQVTLPALQGSTLPQSNIDNVTIRRKIFSTAVIQEQVRLCCCAGNDVAPARVTSITPASSTVFTDNTVIPPSILITFDKHLVSATVTTSTITVLLIPSDGPSKLLQGNVTYDDGSLTATFTPAQPFTIPGVYQVTVIGAGPTVILDADNLALDGNADGTPGGNFLSQFTVRTVNPTATPTPTPTVAPTPTPVTATVLGPKPIPKVPPSKTAAMGAMELKITGGVAGQTVTANLTIVLSQNLATTSAADTANWTDSAGFSAKATKGPNPNEYTFAGVTVTEPGSGAALTVKIANMKTDVSPIKNGGTVTAVVGISSAASITVINPSQVVATVLAG